MILVTTPINPSIIDRKEAIFLANFLGYPFAERGKRTIASLLKEMGCELACVVKEGEVKLVKDGQNFMFHPNMAMLRIDQLTGGGRDRLLEISGVQEGDFVLDCTLGMGSDSLVFAYGVGHGGAVLGIESSPLLTELVKRGFQGYKHPLLEPLVNRITVHNCNYRDYLHNQADNSVDIVYFDPMFEATYHRANGLKMVRYLADYTPLDTDVLNEAIRVARRSVVVKDGAPAPTLKRLSIPIVSKGRKTCYGRIDLQSSI